MPSEAPKQTPETRADRLFGNEVELVATEAFLYRMADAVNALTRAGAIYGQLVLSPDEAAAKRQLMEQGRQA